jgi:hypothetical protein
MKKSQSLLDFKEINMKKISDSIFVIILILVFKKEILTSINNVIKCIRNEKLES